MRDKLLQILTDLRPEFDFTENVNFIEEGMLDSFDIVSLIPELESSFGISIDGTDILPENFSSIDAILSLVDKKKSNG